MSSRLYESFRRVNATRRPEHSVSLRVAVTVAVMVAVAGVGTQAAAATTDVVAALVLIPVGAVVSYRRREEDNTVVKLLLTLGAGFALYRFFGQLQLAGTIEDTRLPLANLFLAVQILHGFDLPQRRDLGFTLASSLALISLAASGVRGSAFGVVVLLYAAATAIASAALQRAAARDEATDTATELGLRPLRRPAVARTSERLEDVVGTVAASGATLLRASGPALLVGLLVFLLLPRTDAARLGGMPFVGFGDSLVGVGSVVNGGLPYGGAGEGDAPGSSEDAPAFNPDAYFGLAESVDLRTRGELSDDLVMRVRSSRPRFWRGMVFDTYGGSTWVRSSADELPEERRGIPIHLPVPRQPGVDLDPVVQTYELVQDTPNLIFAAADPVEIYHAGQSVGLFPEGTITTGAVQEEGIVYSVISLVDMSSPEQLRRADGEIPDDIQDTYLQLPDTLPERVRELGRDLAAQGDTPYEKAEAVERWLGENVEYSLDPTRQPPDRDAVDWFLFDHQRGWCEQIASSMVVMLRSTGVPARFATGFAPGSRNPFSGWYEVRMSDAHAWVEVWVPGHGWTPFDPTGAVPQAIDTSEEAPRLALVDLGRWIRDRVPGIAAIRRLADAIASTGGALAVTATLILGLAAVLAVRRRHRVDDRPEGPFDELERLLSTHGVPREPWQTPREFISRVRLRRPELPIEPLRRLLELEEARRYGTGIVVPATEADPSQDLEELRAVLDAPAPPLAGVGPPLNS